METLFPAKFSKHELERMEKGSPGINQTTQNVIRNIRQNHIQTNLEAQVANEDAIVALGEIRRALADIKSKKDGYSERIEEVEKKRALNAAGIEKKCNIRLIPAILEKKIEKTMICKTLENTEHKYKTVTTFGSPEK